MTARSRRAVLALVAASGLVAGTATGVAGATPDPERRRAAAGSTVTLLTGDRVLLHDAGFASVQAGPGRERVGFHTFHRDGRLHVVPHDAVEAIARDRLDPRLFDVTGLVEAGYGDADRDTVPLVVTRHADAPLRAATALTTRDLPGAVAAQAPKSDAGTAFRALVDDPGVRKVWLDGIRRPSLDRSVAQIGAPTAWQAGFTGQGVKVAVLDSGVDQTHPDLVGREAAERNFTEDPDTSDLVGHGTHVAATIASSGPEYKGVAPDAQILDAKVCSLRDCAESAILAGMQWAVEQGADVVNLSLGGADTPGADPLEEAVDALSERHGTLFVIAAGNSGRPGTIGSPGSADAALTVGAVDRQDGIAPFSSRGPRVGDGAVKPDITAPGVDVVAAKSSSGRVGTPVDEDHVAMSGTSMATPHVAGAAALLAQQHPDWTGAQLKAALMASAKNNPALTAFDQGVGRVDLPAAITNEVTSNPTSLAMGFQAWPHDDDTPVTEELTYRNSGARAVTFDVSLDVKGPDGAPAAAGMFTVTPTTVTVPAGGEARVSVTADTRVGTADGAFSGAVVAGDVLRTPIGVDRQVEGHDLTATFVDANGRAPTGYSGILIGLDNDVVMFMSGAEDTVTARLPRGEYMVHANVTTGDPLDGRVAVLPRPSLTVAGPTDITFDARTAAPLRVTAPDPDPTPMLAQLSVARSFGGERTAIGSLFIGGFPAGLAIAGAGPALPPDQLLVTISSQVIGTPVDGTPVNYRFAWLEKGRVPTGFVRAPAKRDLAEVRTGIGRGQPDHVFALGAAPFSPDGSGPVGALFDVPNGGEAIDYLTGDDFRWRWLLTQGDDTGGLADFRAEDRTYRNGRSHRERFNSPVFGPGLPASPYDYLSRVGDRIAVQVPLVNDAANHLAWSDFETARTTLHRNGQEVGRSPQVGGTFDVPPGAADYRAEVDFVRAPGISDLTSRVSGAWTFRSDTVPGERSRRLPLTVVRFTPRLDADGGAPAGRFLLVPLTVQQQEGADNGRVRRVEVEVSFDDGRTWSGVPVLGGAALVRHPDRAGFASLRARGSDSLGNTFEHSVIRAYRIG
ncbi:S8 family serine peptidase [Saccharothrix sp. HUAS TT1]|uniref:S8 family serine peptidase n=1 Tax=unclassified Saccharothrix TaxID=2593673 RepID=UPI00345BAF99